MAAVKSGGQFEVPFKVSAALLHHFHDPLSHSFIACIWMIYLHHCTSDISSMIFFTSRIGSEASSIGRPTTMKEAPAVAA